MLALWEWLCKRAIIQYVCTYFQQLSQTFRLLAQPFPKSQKYHYPSKREELVEDALRKFVAEGQGLFLDDQAGVTFSLHQLQQELKRNGHSYSKDEIKESLRICAGTNIELESADGGDTIMLGNIFQSLGLQTRRDNLNADGQQSRAFVSFNPLVTASIKNGNFRRFNYAKKYGLQKRDCPATAQKDVPPLHPS